MKNILIAILCIISFVSCVKQQPNKYLWPNKFGSEIKAKINNSIDDLISELEKDPKEKIILKLPSKVINTIASPNGMKLKVTFANGSSKIYVQNDFDYSFTIGIDATYSIKSPVKKVNEVITTRPIYTKSVNIKINFSTLK